MPSNTYVKPLTATTVTQVFGYAKNRTSWTIYNTHASGNVYWGNTRVASSSSGFKVPANTAFTLKLPEDDPTKEVWVYPEASLNLFVYEGFAE